LKLIGTQRFTIQLNHDHPLAKILAKGRVTSIALNGGERYIFDQASAGGHSHYVYPPAGSYSVDLPEHGGSIRRPVWCKNRDINDFDYEGRLLPPSLPYLTLNDSKGDADCPLPKLLDTNFSDGIRRLPTPTGIDATASTNTTIITTRTDANHKSGGGPCICQMPTSKWRHMGLVSQWSPRVSDSKVASSHLYE
jgi:hypothetical protein